MIRETTVHCDTTLTLRWLVLQWNMPVVSDPVNQKKCQITEDEPHVLYITIYILDYFSCKYTRKLALLPDMRKVFVEPHTFFMNPVPSLEERCICCGNPNEENTESTIKEISEVYKTCCVSACVL